MSKSMLSDQIDEVKSMAAFEVREKRFEKGMMLLFGLILTVYGGMIFHQVGFKLLIDLKGHSKATAIIVDSEGYTKTNISRGAAKRTEYYIKTKSAFSVNGVQYINKHSFSTNGTEGIAFTPDNLRVGQPLTVHYIAGHPEYNEIKESETDTVNTPGGWIITIASLSGFLSGLVLLVRVFTYHRIMKYLFAVFLVSGILLGCIGISVLSLS